MTTEVGGRRLPVGAEPTDDGGASFRVWAPRCTRVQVVLGKDGSHLRSIPLVSEGTGYFSGSAEDVAPGALYRYRLDDDDQLYPDPASRFQPVGPHGPSELIDPTAFAWTDHTWRGTALHGQVFYELHVGTFTPEGTWTAAARKLPELAELGVSVVEIMPVADFPGRFGWGYDGVNVFAPTRLYGRPDEFRRFVDLAHAFEIAIVLDVVYNHLGPSGNYLGQFSDDYFTDRYANEWGDAVNLDGPGSGPVREFFIENAAYWIDEFHLDGLRLDAVHRLFDTSDDHFIAAVCGRLRRAGGVRQTLLVVEDENQDTRFARPAMEGSCVVDALWNDDFHHAARVALTGQREGYYSAFLGSAQELVSATRRGFLYQGQRNPWRGRSAGAPTLGLPLAAFVTYLENHDQVANSVRGERLWRLSHPGRYRAITALALLGPGTPMLFQGQEFGSSKPFLYFADHEPDLAAAVAAGRAEFLSQFPSIADPAALTRLDDPADPATFERCKLDWLEREANPQSLALHRDLIDLRRRDTVIKRQGGDGLDGAVLNTSAFALRFFSPAGIDRLMLVNLGPTALIEVVSEPLLAPPPAYDWRTLWSSEDPRYGGSGTPPIVTDRGFWLPGEAAVLLGPATQEL